jgi:hypothetical protein
MRVFHIFYPFFGGSFFLAIIHTCLPFFHTFFSECSSKLLERSPILMGVPTHSTHFFDRHPSIFCTIKGRLIVRPIYVQQHQWQQQCIMMLAQHPGGYNIVQQHHPPITRSPILMYMSSPKNHDFWHHFVDYSDSSYSGDSTYSKDRPQCQFITPSSNDERICLDSFSIDDSICE